MECASRDKAREACSGLRVWSFRSRVPQGRLSVQGLRLRVYSMSLCIFGIHGLGPRVLIVFVDASLMTDGVGCSVLEIQGVRVSLCHVRFQSPYLRAGFSFLKERKGLLKLA